MCLRCVVFGFGILVFVDHRAREKEEANASAEKSPAFCLSVLSLGPLRTSTMLILFAPAFDFIVTLSPESGVVSRSEGSTRTA